MEVVINGVTIQGMITPEGTLSGEVAPYIIKAQPKTAIPSTSEQVVKPDEGYDYLTEVTVSAIPAPKTQSKTATPGKDTQTILPDDGYDGLSSVTVGSVPYREIPNQSGITVEIGG